nr:MAG TPA: hypothetical protein [Caudoviricetes sp.]
MDLIYTDTSYIEKGVLKRCEIDFEVGSVLNSSSTNDFQIILPTDLFPKEIEEGSLIYEVGSEYGGVVRGFGSDTSKNRVTIYGIMWRGLLSKKIIEPPANQAYYQARGEANLVLADLVNDEFNDLLIASDDTSGISVYRDFRYTNMLEGIENMLFDQSARIEITTSYNAEDRIQAIISAVPISDLSNEYEFSNDYGITLNAKKMKNGVNHVICLGQGELTERTVIHLYKLEDGTITTDSADAIKGLDEYTITYDYSSAETEEDLIEGGKKQFANNADEESLSITISESVEVGDIVGARERITGIYMKKPVTQKVLKGNIDRAKVSYKVGE